MIALALTLALAAPAPAQVADPLAPARAGRLQCHLPDAARRTCAGLAGYRFAADGTIVNWYEALADAETMMIVRDEQPAVVRDGAVCSRLSDFRHAVVTVGGEPAHPALDAVRRERLAARSAELGTESCGRCAPQGDDWRVEAAIDGRRRPELDQTMIWVSPQDGYVVGP